MKGAFADGLEPRPQWTSSLQEAEALVARTKSSALYEDALRELNGWTSGLFGDVSSSASVEQPNLFTTV